MRAMAVVGVPVLLAVTACSGAPVPARRFAPPPDLDAKPEPTRAIQVAPLAVPDGPDGLILGIGPDGASLAIALTPPTEVTAEARAAWPASAWAAVVGTAELLGTTPGAYPPAGPDATRGETAAVDAPERGAAAAAGLLAAMIGATPGDAAAPSGVILPDGSLGPSAAGAASAADLRAAYARITGEELLAPAPVDAADMALDDSANDLLTERYAAWRKSLGLHWDVLLAVKARRALPPELAALADRAERYGSDAERLLEEGRVAAAYARIVDANAYASAATTLLRVLDEVRSGDVDGARFLISAELAEPESLRQTLDAIAAREPATVGGALAHLSALHAAIAGLGLQQWASQHEPAAIKAVAALDGASASERSSEATAAAITIAAAAPLLTRSLGDARARASLELLAIDAGGGDAAGTALRVDGARARKRGGVYSEAAVATLAYFESITVGQLAEQTGAPADSVATRFGLVDPDWVTAHMASTLAVPETDASDLHAYAAGTLAQLHASILIARWYSLGIERDVATGETTRVRRASAVPALLTAAERKAREHAREAATAVGFVPIAARRWYQTAVALREGGTADQVAALEAFWHASAASKHAVAVAQMRTR